MAGKQQQHSMTFEERKADCLHKMMEMDKSKKGSVDKPAWPFLDAVNEHPHMYTTSSCSGRIMLGHEVKGGRKNEYGWPLVTHELADADAFVADLARLAEAPGTVWLRMQTAIVHIACRNVETASQLLRMFHMKGWKKSGIFSLANDLVMVQLVSVEGMDAPVVSEGRRLVDDDYVRTFIAMANEKLAAAHEKLRLGVERMAELKEMVE